MKSILLQRNFGLVWTAGLISALGDWMLFSALPFYVYTVTGSVLATGTMFIVEMLPILLFGSLAGVFADRWDRRRTMIVADVLRAAFLLPLLTVRSVEGIWVVYVVAFAQSLCGQFFSPARGALLPRLVSEEHLVAANSLNSLSDGVTRLIGPAAGGVLLAVLGVSGVVVFDSLSFLLSAVLIALVALPSQAPAGAIGADSTGTVDRPAETWLTKVWIDWFDGLRLVRQSRLVAAVFIVMGVFMCGQGIINVLIAPFVKEVIRGGAESFGALVSAQGVGALVGGMLIGQAQKMLSLPRLLTLSLAATTAIFIAIVNIPMLAVTISLAAVLGVPVVGFFVDAQTILQSKISDQYRGRVLGAFATTNAVLTLIGMGIASGFGNTWGIVPVLNIAAGLFVCASVLAWLLVQGFTPAETPQR